MKEIYVAEKDMPKCCSDCDLLFESREYVRLYKGQPKKNMNTISKCQFGYFYKYTMIDDEIDTCPLKSLEQHDTEITINLANKLATAEAKCRELEEKLAKSVECNFKYGDEIYFIRELKQQDLTKSADEQPKVEYVVNKGIVKCVHKNKDIIFYSIPFCGHIRESNAYKTYEQAEAKLKELNGGK